MPLLDETLTSFAELEAALGQALGRVERERELLRRLDAPALLESATGGAASAERLQELLSRATSQLSALCREAGAGEATLEGLRQVAPAVAQRVSGAVEGARRAGRALQLAEAFNRDVTTRALALVRALEHRLPVTGAAYGRGGSAVTARRAVTTSRRA